MQVDIKVNPCVEDVEVLITAEKKTQFVNDLVEVIWDFDKHTVTTLTGYIDNRAYIIKVADILRIFALNQKVYIQTANGEFLTKYRLYEIEDVLRKQKFLRISNSEIVNIRKIEDIDLSIIGRVCIRLSGDICVYGDNYNEQSYKIWPFGITMWEPRLSRVFNFSFLETGNRRILLYSSCVSK